MNKTKKLLSIDYQALLYGFNNLLIMRKVKNFML
jgi:hypothetical protein